MLIPKASSNAAIFAATQRRQRTNLARRAELVSPLTGPAGPPLPAPEGAIYEVSWLDVDRASESSGPNRTTTRENNEKKENRHA